MPPADADADFNHLHPLTKILGTIGPLMVGTFGPTAIIFHYVDFAPDLLATYATHATILGLVLFIIGALTIPLQKQRLEHEQTPPKNKLLLYYLTTTLPHDNPTFPLYPNWDTPHSPSSPTQPNSTNTRLHTRTIAGIQMGYTPAKPPHARSQPDPHDNPRRPPPQTTEPAQHPTHDL